MGILNVTDNSFFDGGEFNTLESAKIQVSKMIEEGVDIIDVGGASSKPGAEEISVQKEIDRVLPVIEFLESEFPHIPVSIDTNRAVVAREAIVRGAEMVNDISAGDDDEDMLKTVGDLSVPYIAMHKLGTPKTMQVNPQYTDVVEQVLSYFVKKNEAFSTFGITDVIVDPGFGFGKTVEHNYALLRNLDVFSKLLGRPILAGLSRKAMINKVLGTSPGHALNGTTVLNTLAVSNGANILRVHDVQEAKQVVRLLDAYNG